MSLGNLLKKSGAAIALLVLALVVAAWIIDVDATRVGDELLRRTRTATGLDFQISGSRMNLLRGIELENVVASGSFPTGRYTVTMKGMRFEHRIWPLFRGALELERVVVEGPEIEVLFGLPLVSEAPAESSGGGRRRRREREPSKPVETERPELDWSIIDLVLREGTVLVRDVRRSDEGVRVNGLELTLHEPRLRDGALTVVHGARASGELRARELRLGGAFLRGVEADLDTAAGKMELTGSFQTEHGDFEGTVSLNFNSLPFRHRIEMRARLEDARMRITTEGFGLDPTKLKGAGGLQLSGETDEIPLRIENGRVLLEGDRWRGTIELDGRLELEGR